MLFKCGCPLSAFEAADFFYEIRYDRIALQNKLKFRNLDFMELVANPDGPKNLRYSRDTIAACHRT
jgi:hypothetical protein